MQQTTPAKPSSGMAFLPPISSSSTQGWFLNAPTCAPSTPRREGGGAGVGEAFGFGVSNTNGWVTTARSDFSGAPQERVRPFFRKPVENLLSSGLDDADPMRCTSHLMHMDPGVNRDPRRRIHSNAPSEADHPLFGLPALRKGQYTGPCNSLSRDSYGRHAKGAYTYNMAEPPYKDTATTALSESWRMADQLTEKQANYRWPKWSGGATMQKPISELVIQ